MGLESDPDNRQVLSCRGKAYEALKYYKSAIRDFSRAVQIDPAAATAELYYNLGKNYLLDGEFNKAIATLTKVIQKQPAHGLAYANRGVAYNEKGEYAQATHDFRKAVSLLKEKARIAVVNRLLDAAEKRLQVTRQAGPFPIIPQESAELESRPAPEKQLW